jgi:5-methylcytosine-specific restriction enzyme subunit McrC
VTSRSDLALLREGQVLDDVDLTRAEAVALNATDLVGVMPSTTGWRVAAAQVVGAVRCGDLEVRVAPKVGAAKVLSLLARAHGVRGLTVDPARLGLSDDADLSVVLAVLFEEEARTALVRGPVRGYRTEDQSLPVVRGRIRLVDQHLRRFGMLTPIEVTVDEWTLDTDDNRRLRAAVRALQRLGVLPVQTAAGLRGIDRLLGEVYDLPPGTRLPPWQPTRLNTHLHRLLALADLVLAGSGVEHRVGGVDTHGFTLRMEWVFERLVEQIFDECCGGPGLRLAAQARWHLDTGARLTIKPDLVVRRGTTHIAVADTKYKLLDDSGKFPNADAYQLVTYCLRLGLPVGHLIYAAADHPVPQPYAIRGTDVVLQVHAIDLLRPVADVEAHLAETFESVVAVRALPAAPN